MHWLTTTKINAGSPQLDANIVEITADRVRGRWQFQPPGSPSSNSFPTSPMNMSRDSTGSFNPTEITTVKELKTATLSPFLGDPLEWSNWYAESRAVLGNNRWLALAEKDMSFFLTEREHSAGDALYWQLTKAVAKGSLKSIVSDFEPRKGENYGDERGAWQAIVNRYDTETQISLQADGWDDMLRNLQFTPKNGKTIAKHVRFQYLLHRDGENR